MDLRIKNNNATKSYVITNNCTTRPRVCMKSDTGVPATPISYLPLTTSTTQGLALRAKVNDQSYRALEFRSMSGSATFYSSNANGQGLSSTTALTRASTSRTEYLTQSSTSRTEYLTRSSTSATSYLTRSSTSGESYLTKYGTMLLIQRHVKSTYGTYGTYANVTWVTADEHAISSLYPAYAYSNANTYWNIRVNSTSIMYPSQLDGYTYTASTGPQSGQYQATEKMRVTFWESYYFGNSWKNRTNYWMYQSGSYTSSFWGYDGYTLTTNGNYTLTNSRSSWLLESGYPQLAFIATTSSISNRYIDSSPLINGFQTNVANRMLNYSTDSAFSTTFASTTLVTVTWGDNKYNLYTINETASFGHETQTTGTSYLTRSSTYSTVYYTRSSTYDTVYYTRSSTYSTVYHTRSSTSGYSGVSSSSSETSGWQ